MCAVFGVCRAACFFHVVSIVPFAVTIISLPFMKIQINFANALLFGINCYAVFPLHPEGLSGRWPANPCVHIFQYLSTLFECQHVFTDSKWNCENIHIHPTLPSFFHHQPPSTHTHQVHDHKCTNRNIDIEWNELFRNIHTESVEIHSDAMQLMYERTTESLLWRHRDNFYSFTLLNIIHNRALTLDGNETLPNCLIAVRVYDFHVIAI